MAGKDKGGLMRIAVLSDVSGPTHPDYPGHGLGRAVHWIADGLRQCDHDVTLIATEGSAFAGELITPCKSGLPYEAELYLAKAAYQVHKQRPFDVFYDHGHTHVLSRTFPDLPVVNHFHDIWQGPARNPVLCSEGQRALMPDWVANAVVIPHTVDPTCYPFNLEADKPEFALYLGILRNYKQPMLAIEACVEAGIKLVMAGPAAPEIAALFSTGTNVEYVGPIGGEVKLRYLQRATCLLQLGTHESFGLTTVEAGLCGTPVVAWPSGGAVDIVEYGVSGVFVPLGGNRVQAVADAIDRARDIDRVLCRTRAMQFTNRIRQMDQVQDVLRRACQGVWW